MSTRLACAVDHDDARTGLGDEGIRECHSHRSGTYHQVVGFDGFRRPLRWPGPRVVHGPSCADWNL